MQNSAFKEALVTAESILRGMVLAGEGLVFLLLGIYLCLGSAFGDRTFSWLDLAVGGASLLLAGILLKTGWNLLTVYEQWTPLAGLGLPRLACILAIWFGLVVAVPVAIITVPHDLLWPLYVGGLYLLVLLGIFLGSVKATVE